MLDFTQCYRVQKEAVEAVIYARLYINLHYGLENEASKSIT